MHLKEELTYDIGNVDKETLIRALWRNASYSAFYITLGYYAPTSLCEEELALGLQAGRFDHLSGKPIKIVFNGNKVNASGYNQHLKLGSFSFEQVLLSLN